MTRLNILFKERAEQNRTLMFSVDIYLTNQIVKYPEGRYIESSDIGHI